MHAKQNTQKNITSGIVCTAKWRLTEVKPLTAYRLKVKFDDGTQGVVDISQRVMSDKAGVFKKLREIDIFNQVYLEYGVVTWPGGIDLAPDAMYDAILSCGKWVLE